MTDHAVYVRSRNIPSVQVQRWPLWAIVELHFLGALGMRVLTMSVRDPEVVGWPPVKVTLYSGKVADLKECLALASTYIREVIGEPESEQAIGVEMADVTGDWEAPVVLRRYAANDLGHARLRRETLTLGRHGYAPGAQVSETGRLKTGQLLATGGIGAAIGYARGTGGLHEIGTLSVTFVKIARPTRSDDVVERLERLAALHSSGALSEAEYEEAKARVLASGP